MKKYDLILIVCYAIAATFFITYRLVVVNKDISKLETSEMQDQPAAIIIIKDKNTSVKIQEMNIENLCWYLESPKYFENGNGEDIESQDIFSEQNDTITIDTRKLINKEVILKVKGDIPVNISKENH